VFPSRGGCFKFFFKYLNFGATYFGFGAIYLNFVTIYLNFGAIYCNFGGKIQIESLTQMTQTGTVLLCLLWLCACHHSTAVPLVKSGGGGSDDNINVHQSSFTTNSLTSDECAAQTAEKLSAAGVWMLGVRALHTELVQFRVAVKQSGLEV